MDHVQKQLINNQLSHLRVHLLLAKHTVCTSQWQKHRFIPSYDKLYYICDGEGWIRVGREQLWPKPGDLILIPGGIEQSYSTTDGKPFTKYWCHFKSNINFLAMLQQFNLSKVIQAGDSPELRHHFQELTASRSEPGPATSIKIQSSLLSIIAYFMDHTTMNNTVDVDATSPQIMLETIQFIDTHLSRELSIEELSQNAHFHPNYFIRIFKRHLGMTPMRYIHERRLEKAQQLLGATKLTVSEIAYRCGFKDLSYFSAAFKKKAGVSPSDYRKLFLGTDRMSV